MDTTLSIVTYAKHWCVTMGIRLLSLYVTLAVIVNLLKYEQSMKPEKMFHKTRLAKSHLTNYGLARSQSLPCTPLDSVETEDINLSYLNVLLWSKRCEGKNPSLDGVQSPRRNLKYDLMPQLCILYVDCFFCVSDDGGNRSVQMLQLLSWSRTKILLIKFDGSKIDSKITSFVEYQSKNGIW